MKILGKYHNGNHVTTIWDDGSKLQETIDPEETVFTYDFPESFDFKVNNRCSGNCPWCHEKSSSEGKLPDLSEFVQSGFYKSIRPFTEMAIGGGNIFESPDIEILLDENRNREIIGNVTVNQKHVAPNIHRLESWVSGGLVHGIGISFSSPSKEFGKLLDGLGPNVVIHCIAGILETDEQLDFLSGRKVLLLGYKNFGLGAEFMERNGSRISRNMDWLKSNLGKLKNTAKVLSFDCLGIDQLSPKQVLDIPDGEWYRLFQGRDDETMDSTGKNILCSTMYVDLPNLQIARSSSSPQRWPLDLDSGIETAFATTAKEFVHGN